MAVSHDRVTGVRIPPVQHDSTAISVQGPLETLFELIIELVKEELIPSNFHIGSGARCDYVAFECPIRSQRT